MDQLFKGPSFGCTVDLLRLLPLQPIVAILIEPPMYANGPVDRNLCQELLQFPQGLRQLVLVGDFTVPDYRALFMRLQAYPAMTILRMPVEEAVTCFPNNYFDMIYCIGNVLCKMDWFLRVRPQGLLAGDTDGATDVALIKATGVEHAEFTNIKMDQPNAWLLLRPRKWKAPERQSRLTD